MLFVTELLSRLRGIFFFFVKATKLEDSRVPIRTIGVKRRKKRRGKGGMKR